MNGNSKTGILLLCYGNPAREDDGIGPALADRIERFSLAGVRVESSYQLCVEDAVGVAESRLVVFVDASVSGREPFSFQRIRPRSDDQFMSHSIEPGPLLGLTRDTLGRAPKSFLLTVRGYSFEMFKEGLTQRAEKNLDAALDFLIKLLRAKTGSGEIEPVTPSKSFGG